VILMQERLKQAIELINQILEDRTVPRNIRDHAEKAKNSLLDEEHEISVRVNKATHTFDEVSEDSNMPIYTRTQIWNIVTVLESILHK